MSGIETGYLGGTSGGGNLTSTRPTGEEVTACREMEGGWVVTKDRSGARTETYKRNIEYSLLLSTKTFGNRQEFKGTDYSVTRVETCY